jgi:hypothetical protein
VSWHLGQTDLGSAWQPLDPALPASATLPTEWLSTVAALAVDPAGDVYAGGQFVDKKQQLVTHYLTCWTGQYWDHLPQAGT